MTDKTDTNMSDNNRFDFKVNGSTQPSQDFQSSQLQSLQDPLQLILKRLQNIEDRLDNATEVSNDGNNVDSDWPAYFDNPHAKLSTLHRLACAADDELWMLEFSRWMAKRDKMEAKFGRDVLNKYAAFRKRNNPRDHWHHYLADIDLEDKIDRFTRIGKEPDQKKRKIASGKSAFH